VSFYGAMGSPDSAAIMGELGLRPLCTSIGDLEKQAAFLRNWEVASGHLASETSCPIMVDCIVADTDEEAVAEACEFKPRYMQAQIDWEHTPGYEAWKQIFAGMQARTKPAGIVPWTRWQLIGSPETVASKLNEFVDIGFNHIILQFSTPGVPVEVRRRWASLFAAEVAPSFSPEFAAGRVPAAAP
jgi:alkanesulfonate monooxygenase SsuD/methylene tetrahydromethanopterin reductase-like flavin-dependent oxidoreductase (luciferase family)